MDTNVLAYAEGANGAIMRDKALKLIRGLPPEAHGAPGVNPYASGTAGSKNQAAYATENRSLTFADPIRAANVRERWQCSQPLSFS